MERERLRNLIRFLTSFEMTRFSKFILKHLNKSNPYNGVYYEIFD
jgi:hypothetical protein